MKHANWVVIAALVVFSSMAVAQTIGSARIVTDVPFEFVTANKIVPAGTYEVQASTMDGKTLVIWNSRAKVNMFLSPSQAEEKESASHYALVFNRYGDHYFLSGIKLEGSKTIYRMPESRAEAELRAENVSATEETLLAAKK